MDVKNIISGNVRKVAIFRALQLGDMLCSIPAVRAFKTHYPNSEITLIGLPWAEVFVRRFSGYFSSFLPFPGYPGLVEQPFDPIRFGDFLALANERDIDLIVQMHGNGSITNRVVSGLGAKIKAGYFDGVNEPGDGAFMPYPEGIHETEKHLRLMEFFGVPVCGRELEFPITEKEEEICERLCNESDLKSGEYVCIHPGARDSRRRWSPEYFASIADTIMDKGFRVALTGTSAEHAVVRNVEKCMRNSAVNLSGKTGLGVLAALIRRARLLICNDTGVSHIAAAVSTPSVIVFLDSDPKRWAPLNQALHQAILPSEAGNIDCVLFNVEQKLLDGDFNKKSLQVA